MDNKEQKSILHKKVPGWAEKISIISLSVLILFVVVQTVKSAEFILDPVKKVTTVTETLFTRVLKVGMTGQDVSALQMILGQENQTALQVTGVFGSLTQSAVKVFQEKYPVEILIPAGLISGDGIVGPTTMAKLNQLNSKYNLKLSDFPPVSTSTVKIINIFTRDLRVGDTGDDVILLKNILNSDPATALIYPGNKIPAGSENLFDDATRIAVIKFQEKYAKEIGASATGLVGPATRKKLNSMLTDFLSDTAKQDAIIQSLVSGSSTATKITVGQNTTAGIPQVQEENPTSGKCPLYVYKTSEWSDCEPILEQTWSQCASEGGTCTFNSSNPSNIRYGHDTRWVYGANFTTDVSCNNATFGDPAVQQPKVCQSMPVTAKGIQRRTITKEQSGEISCTAKAPIEPEHEKRCTYRNAVPGLVNAGGIGSGSGTDLTGDTEDKWCTTDSNSFNLGGLSDSLCDTANGFQKIGQGDILGGVLDVAGGLINTALSPAKALINYIGNSISGATKSCSKWFGEDGCKSFPRCTC